MPTCFVIMPITTPPDWLDYYGGDEDHFEHVLEYLFRPALVQAGYDVIPPSVSNSQIIQAEIILNLENADLVLCDMSASNPNVFFELGIRVALDRPVALVKDNYTANIPFDNAPVSCHTYEASIASWIIKEQIEKLAEFAKSAGVQDRNALWKYFGITQRGSSFQPDDPVEAKLDLVLSHLQQLTATTRSIEATSQRQVPATMLREAQMRAWFTGLPSASASNEPLADEWPETTTSPE